LVRFASGSCRRKRRWQYTTRQQARQCTCPGPAAATTCRHLGMSASRTSIETSSDNTRGRSWRSTHMHITLVQGSSHNEDNIVNHVAIRAVVHELRQGLVSLQRVINPRQSMGPSI
jgi:hypothetical protein